MSVSLASEASPYRRARRPSARKSRLRARPAIFVLLVVGLVALGVLGFREWLAGRVTLSFVRADGTVPDLELTVFPDQLSFTTPSPPPPLGTVHAHGGEPVTFDSDLVPQRAVIRYRGAGVGAGVVFVELGKEVAPIELTPPRTIRGRVGEPIGFWAFGWRSGGLRPVADAEIVAMAGGEHGIEVATVRSGEDGRFELSGISASVHPLSLRVRAPGYAISHIAVPDSDTDTDTDTDSAAPIVAAVEKTTRLNGTIDAPAEVERTKLCVLVRGLPGVQVFPAADGSFVLDHLPPDVRPRLFVHGLDAWHGCAEVRARRDADVRLTVVAAGVVRGTVMDGVTGKPLARALVFAGKPTVRSDDDGKFELTRVLPGRVELTAQYRKKRPKRRDGPVRVGRTRIDLRGGETLEGIVVTIK